MCLCAFMLSLSEALARLHLDDVVRPIYVREAYRLLQQSIIFVDMEDVELDNEDEGYVGPEGDEGGEGGGEAGTAEPGQSDEAGDLSRQQQKESQVHSVQLKRTNLYRYLLLL